MYRDCARLPLRICMYTGEGRNLPSHIHTWKGGNGDSLQPELSAVLPARLSFFILNLQLLTVSLLIPACFFRRRMGEEEASV